MVEDIGVLRRFSKINTILSIVSLIFLLMNRFVNAPLDRSNYSKQKFNNK